jgi:hypothetical protein
MDVYEFESEIVTVFIGDSADYFWRFPLVILIRHLNSDLFVSLLRISAD